MTNSKNREGAFMKHFEMWEHATLVKFAQDASAEIVALQEELRVALDAYRKIVVEHAQDTNQI